MTTPYDTALRVQRREVDAVKVSISVEVERITSLEAAERENEQRTRDERALAYTMPFPTDAWVAKQKMEKLRIQEAAYLAQARLGQLRAQAVEAYGTMRAIEGAAERYAEEAERVIVAAEQASIDDIAAARFLQAQRLLRKRPS